MKKTLLILLLMATARAHESPVAAPTVAPVSQPTEAEQEQILAEAKVAYDKENYARALELFHQLAAVGHAEAMEYIGLMYQYGNGVALDYASAKEWFEMAGDAGRLNGYGWVGKLYEEGGPGLEKDLEQACRYYQKAGSKWQEEAEKVCSR